MDRSHVVSWVERYERLWRTPGTDSLGTLFAEEVRYAPSPWSEPVAGLPAMAAFWESEREGANEQFDARWRIVAVDGDVAVVRVAVDYANGDRWLDLWVITFGPDGRCVAFEEWPIAPDDD